MRQLTSGVFFARFSSSGQVNVSTSLSVIRYARADGRGQRVWAVIAYWESGPVENGTDLSVGSYGSYFRLLLSIQVQMEDGDRSELNEQNAIVES